MKEKILPVGFQDALGERYISYAMSTIMSRSLPDVRDGLKPVHRRLLYAMLKLKLDPDSGFKKCARVVGDVIGKYHPHGDVAVYDTMVRMAQSFALRYPLVDGQGNFGSLDGDNAAAMRYTEAKLTSIAMLLLADIDKETVDFKKTYDDSDIEPCLLPTKFPNLLANGSEGIAVGMATSIPPHNIIEIYSALIHLLKTPDCSIKTLTNYIKAPDFPTGAKIYETQESIQKTYETGRGSFKIRANWQKEILEKGSYQIIIEQIPYQVQKARLIEKIAELFKNKKLNLIGGIRDESDENIRIVIEPRSRNVSADLIMEQLYKHSELETKFHLNLNVLDGELRPRVLNLKQVLQEFIDHRLVVQKRKAVFELNKIIHRLEILDGYLVTFLNLDEVIRIIREEDNPKADLIKTFKLTDIQAESILNLKLRFLRKLEEFKIKEEKKELAKKQGFLEKLLKSKDFQKEEILKEFYELKKYFVKLPIARRKSVVINEFIKQDFDETSFIENESITILFSKQGWIKGLLGHNLDLSKVKYKIGDSQKFFLEIKTRDKIIFVSNLGKFYCLDAHKIPRGKTDGQAINVLFDIKNEEKIIEIFNFIANKKYVLATKFAKGFIVHSNDLISQTKNGKNVVNLANQDKLVQISKIKKNDDMIAIANSNKKMLIFKLDELPIMAKGKGVILQRQVSSNLSKIITFDSVEGLSWQSGKKTRIEKEIRGWIGKRAGKGSLVPHGFKV